MSRVGRGAIAPALFRFRGEQCLKLETTGVHSEVSGVVAGPGFFGTVPVELDAVAVGVAQIERFADAVVGGAVEGDAGGDEAPEGVGEFGAGRVEDRDVVEAGRTGRGGDPPWLSQVLRPMWWW